MTAISIKDGSITYAPGTSDAEIEAAARSASRSRHIKVIIWRLVVLAILLGSWEIAARSAWIDPFFYSYPSEILLRLWEFFWEDRGGLDLGNDAPERPEEIRDQAVNQPALHTNSSA